MEVVNAVLQAVVKVKAALEAVEANKKLCARLAAQWARLEECLQKSRHLAGQTHRSALAATEALAEETAEFVAKFNGMGGYIKRTLLQLGGLSEDKTTILDLGQRLDGLMQEMQLAVVVDTNAFLSELEEAFQGDLEHVKALLEGQEQLADGQMKILSKLDAAPAAAAAAAADAVAERMLNLTVDGSYYCKVDENGKKVESDDEEEAELGSGTFGTTYRMRHSLDQRFCAVKVVNMRKAAEHGLDVDDVQREAQMLGKINHPNIVHYFGCQFVGSKKDPRKHFWIIMELVHGDTLYTHIRKAPGASKILKWARQIANGLAYLHLVLRMLHRDIKSHNIMVSPNGSLHLIDLGLAVVVRSSGAHSKVGTAAYASKEKSIPNLSYGPPDDMWGAGCVLAELATRQPLRGALWMNEVQEDRERVIRDSKALSPTLGELVRGLLDVRPGFRLTAKQCFDLSLEDKKEEEEAGDRKSKEQEEKAEEERAKTGAFDHLFNLTCIADQLGKGGVHDVLTEVYRCAQSAPGPAAKELLQLQHCLGRHLPDIKDPPMNLRQTLLQLASQEPAASRVRRAAEAALHKAQEGSRSLIEWTNKWPLPCVMDIREHTGDVYAVAVSPDGKLIASGSEDNTVVVVEAATGRVRCRLRGHRCDACCVHRARVSGRLRRCCAGSVRTWSLATDQCPVASLRPLLYRFTAAVVKATVAVKRPVTGERV